MIRSQGSATPDTAQGRYSAAATSKGNTLAGRTTSRIQMERGDADNFSRMGTLGVEEEFFVVDRRGRPTSGTDELVYGTDPPELLDGRLDHELFKCIIETQTPTLESVDEAETALRAVRRGRRAPLERPVAPFPPRLRFRASASGSR